MAARQARTPLGAIALLLLCCADAAGFFVAAPRGAMLRTSTPARSAAPPVMMAKKVTKLIKLALQAGKANPAPPVGPALGAAGCNIMMFCKEYNARTQDKVGTVIPVEISVYDDRSFSFILKTPPASELLKKAAGIKKGSGMPFGRGAVTAGTVTREQHAWPRQQLYLSLAKTFANLPDALRRASLLWHCGGYKEAASSLRDALRVEISVEEMINTASSP
eukprot:6172394-Pleurochrysis_carterae.AAC.1